MANSPQAKGRVERNHGVYQDRLAKGLRLAGISTIEESNRHLVQTYLPKINEKFAKEPLWPEDAHVPLITPTSLDDIFSYETPRVVSNDYVISDQRPTLPDQAHCTSPSQAKVTCDSQGTARWTHQASLPQYGTRVDRARENTTQGGTSHSLSLSEKKIF
jgi:hypothetical protein